VTKHRGASVLLVMALALGLAVFACAQTKKLTILHTNDTHSAMVPFETGFIPAAGADPKTVPGVGAGLWNFWHFPYNQEYAGIARMASLIKTLRAKDRNVLALHAGDVFVGSFEFNKYLGYPELKIMENLYDVMELGNHEFDLGIDTLAGVLSGQVAGGAPIGLPVICANVDFSGTYLQGMIQPSVIKTVGGVKVGIFGLVTQEPQNYTADVNARFKYPYEGASPTLWEFAGGIAADLKYNQGCEVVVCLSHLNTGLDVMALSQVPYIDVIVGGHSHDVYSQANVITRGDGSKVIIVHAGEFGKYLGELKLVIDNGVITLESWVPHRLDGKIKEDPKVRAAVNQVRAGVIADPRFGQVYDARVAVALRDIAKDWPATGPNRDSALGNMVTDAFRNRLTKAGFPVDCALDVLGYLGADIYAGKVVGNNIMRAVPYGYDTATGLDFKVVVVPLPGQLLIGGLEYAADQIHLTSDMAVQASGLTYAYNSGNPVGSRVDPMSVLVNGEPVALHLDKLYYVAMSEQVYGFLNALVGGALQSIPTNLNEYTIVRDYMKALRFVKYQSEGRIKDTK
jgi:2',3'-cyclic-nucleotide 2'-phosphodiesterase (5'-nucleotidase family)